MVRDDETVLITIRSGMRSDGPSLQAIERSAGEKFRQVGLNHVADDEPPSVESLAIYADAGRSWVAIDETGNPIGYLIFDEIDGNAHISQMSVHPDWQGRGVGRMLLSRAQTWVIDNGRSAITLTTFDSVPWNRSLYEHLGFHVLSEGDIGPELIAIRNSETDRGLAPDERVCMRLDVHAGFKAL